MKVFLVEDNKKLCDELVQFLKSYNHDVYTVINFKDIITEVVDVKPDIVILDINLPYNDGYYLCSEIKNKMIIPIIIPIIILTSRNTTMDEVYGINIGADDFITKPYNPQVLLARIENIARRYKSSVDKKVYGEVAIILEKSELTYKQHKIDLTKNEIMILTILFNNTNKIVSRDDIMNYIWQQDNFIDDNTLTVNINRLRKKLDDIGISQFIHTKRGQGYFI